MSEEDKNQPEKSGEKTSELSIPQAIDGVAKCFAILIGVVYVCGFLTVNSHLGKYGIFNLGLVDTNYLLPGASFTLFIVTYALFGGRGIVFCKDWMSERIILLNKRGAPPSSALLAFIHSFIELVFLHCLATIIFVGIAIDVSQVFLFYVVFGIVFSISYALDIFNFDIRRPFADLIIDSILKLLLIIVYFLLSPSLISILILISFGFFSGYINFVLDKFERHDITTDSLSFLSVYSVIFFLSTAISFGALVYGDVRRELGGGKNISVEIGLDKSIYDSMKEIEKEKLSGKLLFSSDTAVYLNTGDKTLVLPWRNVLWLKSSELKDDDSRQILDDILTLLDIIPGISDEKIEEIREKHEH